MTERVRMGRRAFACALGLAPLLHASERRDVGGRLRIFAPWEPHAMDPHDLHDPIAAFFGAAVFDTLFARSTTHAAYPSLAAEVPTPVGGGKAEVLLRPDLVASDGARLSPEDVAWALERARSRGAAGLLSPFGPFAADARRHAIRCGIGGGPQALARALSSPLTAIFARRSEATRTAATGAFAARLEGRLLTLRRNAYAARGAAYLDGVTFHGTQDLAAALRAFEAAESDVGWLGTGLHGPRKGAQPLRSAPLGWVVLRAGHEAGRWAAPGVAQDLVSTVPSERLDAFGLTVSSTRGTTRRWTGPPLEILVDAGSAHLVEVARTVAAVVSGPGHELTARPIARRDLSEKRRSRRFGMMLDWVTAIGHQGSEPELSLLTAEDPRLARRAPAPSPRSIADVARTLSLGVLGELSIRGAVAPGVQDLGTWSLADAWRPS